MKLQKILKKFLASMLVSIMVIGQLSGLRFATEATTIKSTDGNLYLALSALRGSGMGYAIDMTSSGTEGKQLWGIRSYQTSSSASSSVVASNLYCIKGSYGYTWETLGRPTDVLTYTQSSKGLNEIVTYYNELLWVIDHMYIPGEVNKATFLRDIGINSYEDEEYGTFYYYDSDLTPGHDYSNIVSADEFQFTLTDDDIIAIQQAVVWYFTNYKINNSLYGIYNKKGKTPSWLKYTINGTTYSELSSLNRNNGEGPARSDFAIVLYNYLINAAEREVAGGTYELKNRELKIWTSNSTGRPENEEQPIIEVHKKTQEKKGKYDVVLVKQDENGEQLNSQATFIVNDVEEVVTGRLTIASKQITKDNLTVTDTYVIKETTPPDEYCKFDGIITVSVTKKETASGYEVNNVSYVVRNAAGTDITTQTGQDVKVYLKDGNIYVEVKDYPEEKAFDLALRKAIVQVKNNSGTIKNVVNDKEQNATRNIVIDKSTLNNEDDNRNTDTATYKHRKDPVLVERGDIVKYSLTIYNEGQQAGYARKIVDQLPGNSASGLRLTNTNDITSSTGNVYSVAYSTTTNTVTLTLKSTSPRTIPAYNGTTLSQEKVELECQVMATADSTQKITLTNIAYISEEYNSETNEVITTAGDRDSQPSNYPTYQGENDTMQDGVTYGSDIGYKGNASNPTDLSQNNTYYKGQQDDDDFEKLVILPRAFDLSLRKVITKVDGITTGNNREIKITNLNELATGANGRTTAQYNHIKQPVVVKYGSKVTYNINIYNEADIDGIATIIRDQLPLGLKLDLSSLQTQVVNGKTQYYVQTVKNNKYIVNYNETTNLVTFTLDTTATVTNLQAFRKRTTLDSDTIEFNCIVKAIPDEKSNLYLTNIAYIYEEKDADGTVITNQRGKDRDSEPYTKPNKTAEELNTVDNIGYIGNTSNSTDLGKADTYYKGEQDDDDFEKLVILPQAFDLKLIKYIDEKNGEDVGNRILHVDTTKLNKTGTDGKRITTAEYEMEKNPISVRTSDFIKYTFRIYNEGDYDGYATEISEDIPDGLEALIVERDVEGNVVIYSWDGKNIRNVTQEIKATDMYDEIVATNSKWKYNKDTSIITTEALKDELIKAFGIKDYNNYADKENKIDYKETSVIFRVKEETVPNKEVIRNEAAITKDKAVDKDGNEIIDKDGNTIDDRDSTPEKWGKEDSGKDYNEDKWEIYKEDDEDYDNIIIKEFDLSLRKQITKITRQGKDTLYTGRYAKLDPQNSEENTIYDYYNVYNNKPKVRAGDIVTYSIRVYNEGEIDGYAKLIADALPSGLEFVPYTKGDGSINDKYGWKLVEGTTNVYETDYLSYEKDANKGTEKSNLIKKYTGSGEADYKEVEIQCKVKDNVTKQDSLLNVAQIADDSDEKGKPIKDKDSKPGKTDNESKWKEEDDLDIEILELEEFDLALRKFITKIEETGSENSTTEEGEIKTTEVTSRIPEVSYDRQTGKIIYTHSKDPLLVHVGDTIIYTIRVFNEGDIDGYAQEITDDIPEYLEFLPNHKINKEYEWKMYDITGNETEDITKAVKIKTIYLAKGEGKEKGAKEGDDNYTANLIKSFNLKANISETNPDYRDVNIAFKVKDPNSTEYIIKNFAQISEDADEEGNPIEDIDSTPDNGVEEPKEDDEDIENIKVEYFDLSLLKYVTKAIVTEDGKQMITETGNIGDENDIIPKVEVNKKKLDKTVVKFAYTIKVTNEGNIAGYAKEITDYIPVGLEFKKEDNPDWINEGNGIISTRLLENTLLQPGQSAEVEVILTWINGENNLGSKLNIAEISEDDNDEDVPDKDSTPDNLEEGEDDIDDAEVVLSIKTGGSSNVAIITLISVLFLVVLVGIIEKTVIKRFLKQ